MESYLSFRHWLKDHIQELDGLVLDVDGVLIAGGSRTPGSRALLDYLRKRQIAFCLLTNDGDHSTAEKARTLTQAGIEVTAEEIVSCGDGLVELAADQRLAGELFFVMGMLGDPCYAEKAGLRTTRNPEQLENCRGIIISERGYDWEPTINKVVNFLIGNPKAALVVPNPDEYFLDDSGKIGIAAGAVARFMTHVLGVYGIQIEPVYLGKPFQPIFMRAHHGLERTKGTAINRRRVLLVGDFIEADIRGALEFGYRSALVLTGVTTRENLDRSQIKPELVFEKLK
jgi:HAD superfamily hydrolase (TIGR01450 family)